MSNFGTIEAGSGSYSEPPEEGLKDYTITFNCSCIARVCIQAKSIKEAEEMLKNANLYDLKYKYDFELDEVDFEEIKNIIEE